MPRGGNNRMPLEVKRRYFELIRSGVKGAKAARMVGVSTSDDGRGRHSGGGHARGRRDWRQVLAGTAAGLEVNAASNHIGDWAALAVAVVAVLFAAAWLREYPPTSRLRTTAAGTAVTLAGLALVMVGFGPVPTRLPALLAAVLLTTLATLLPDHPEHAFDTLAGAAFLGAGVATLGLGAARLLHHATLAGAAFLGAGVATLGLGAFVLMAGTPVWQRWRAWVTEWTRPRPGHATSDDDSTDDTTA